MNCLEFRRETLVDPGRPSQGATRHGASCSPCADFRERSQAIDAELREILEVPVPAGLEQRILSDFAHERRRERRRFLAIAASLSGLAFGGLGIFRATRDDPNALAGIQFVIEEEATAILAAKPADRMDLVQAARAMNLWLPDQLGETRYIGTCPFRGSVAHHVILVTPLGKATLLLQPDRHADSRGTASARGLHALVKPAGAGCATVVADSERNVERIEQAAWRA